MFRTAKALTDFLLLFGQKSDKKMEEEIRLYLSRCSARMEGKEKSESKNEEDGSTIYLYGPVISSLEAAAINNEVGDDIFIDAKKVTKQIRSLKNSGETPKIYIDSMGGSVFDSAAISTAISEAKAETNIDGVAASAAAMMFMAGEKRSASKESLFMVHRPTTFTIGTVEDIAADMSILSKIEMNQIEKLHSISNLTMDQAKEAVYKTSWYRKEDMKKIGLIDNQPKTGLTSKKSPASMAYEMRLARARMALAEKTISLEK